MQTSCPWITSRALARLEGISAFCMKWEIKHSWECGHNVSPSIGSMGDQGAKPLKKLQCLAWNEYDIAF